jgi:hypothetical protein
MNERDVDPRSSGRTLDDEGIPDLEGPLPDKAATGDPQEGLSPPSDRPASFDVGVTEAEQQRGESISERVAREEPDLPDGLDDDPVRLFSEDATDLGGDDGELVGDAEAHPTGLGAEDAAVHVRDDAPGAVDRPDSYLRSSDRAED